MGFLGFLNFLVLFTEFLAWPVFALIYPLWSSVRAIESGSKYHMRKLVIYWTLLSFISLFELAFVKIIEWIPFWSHIKLIAVCWLVVPRFNGACHAYESFVRSCFWLNLQAVTGRFLDVAEKYIKENDGSEALERLVATKLKKSDVARTYKEVLEQTKKTVSTETKLMQHAQPCRGALVETKTDAPSDVIITTPFTETKRLLSPPTKKIQRG